MTDRLTKGRKTDTLSSAVAVIHLNAWNPEKHGAAFITPIIRGLTRRLTTDKTADSGGDHIPLKY